MKIHPHPIRAKLQFLLIVILDLYHHAKSHLSCVNSMLPYINSCASIDLINAFTVLVCLDWHDRVMSLPLKCVTIFKRVLQRERKNSKIELQYVTMMASANKNEQKKVSSKTTSTSWSKTRLGCTIELWCRKLNEFERGRGAGDSSLLLSIIIVMYNPSLIWIASILPLTRLP